jgi:hypothetical protein
MRGTREKNKKKENDGMMMGKKWCEGVEKRSCGDDGNRSEGNVSVNVSLVMGDASSIGDGSGSVSDARIS